MCEFKVFLEGKQVAEDVIYARQEEGRVIIRDILGEPRAFNDVKIVEVNVMTTRLLLGKS